MPNLLSPSAKFRVNTQLVRPNGKIMIARRAKKDSLFGKWEFPGGKMESGETEPETLKRELNEEFGIVAHVGEYVCVVPFEYNGIKAEMLAYKVPSFEGEIELREHSAVAWVHPLELIDYEFSQPDLPIVALLQKRI